MKTTLPYFKMLFVILSLGCTGAFFTSCDDDEKPDTVPNVATGTVSDVTGTTATVTGEVINDGGPAITATGFVYSSMNATPTLADSFTEETTTEGTFSSNLEGLTSSTTYHVRAYAINSKGPGYGTVVDFTTSNAAPTATDVSVSGETEVNKELTASYTYNDEDGDTESGTTLQWYVANDGTGAGEAAIAGATATTFTIQEAQQGKYIRVGVTPKSGTGTTTGVEVKSGFVGAIGEATTVTFTYNGQQVTYGIINSPTTGRKWLDRNLGAPNAPSSHTDFANYGDLFQWGRLADGHQLMVRNGPNDADMSPVNGTTSTTSPYATVSTDNPGHALFIVNGDTPNDWRIPENNNLWQGVNGTNNPCPSGWRLTTAEEWAAESLGTLSEAYTKLKITLTSIRAVDSGSIFQSTTTARYWTSTVDVTDPRKTTRVSISSTSTTQSAIARGNGYACRCIKD